MIWVLAHRGMSTRLIGSPFTETPIAGAHSILYRPGVEPVYNDGQEGSAGYEGTYSRGLHRVSGFVFTQDGAGAETLLSITAAIKLLVYYTAARNHHRLRTLTDVVFVGDATVTVPALNAGLGDLVGVPFKVNIPRGETLADHIDDDAE